MSHLIIDIETKPNKSLRALFKKNRKPEKGDDIDKMMATDPDYCEIVCIGIKQVGGETRMLNSIKKLGTKEWSAWLSSMPLVTFNGKRFDIPVLIKHGMRYDVDLPYDRLHGACKRWGYGDRHIDLLEVLSYGERWKSMDEYLRIYLGISKNTLGSDFFKKATIKEIKKHCEEDLEYTQLLAEKFKLI